MSMKKIISALTLVLCLILTCATGCSNSTHYREPERQYLVSAIGFDRQDDLMRVSLEVVIFKVGEAESSIETKVFNGVGESVREGLGSLSGEISKLLLFSHCTLIVLGESLTPAQRQEALDFCTPDNDINISASVICTPDALALLSSGSISTPVTGYDITGVLKQKSQDWGIKLNNKLYQIGDARLHEAGYYSLPKFIVNKDEDEEESLYSFVGIVIHLADSPAIELSLPESALYSLLCGSYGNGSFFIKDDSGDTLSPSVKHASSVVSGEYIGDELQVSINCTLSLDEQRSDIGSPERLAKLLEDRAAEFIGRMTLDNDADLFQIRHRIKIKDNPGAAPDMSALSAINVTFKVK